MPSLDLGPWQPASLDEVVERFALAPFRWWIAGGHALDLHVGRSWRAHADTDVGICRTDARQLPGVLDGWEIAVAAAGELRLWSGEALSLDRHENNLWARSEADGPWELDVIVGEGDAEGWRYRRDPRLRLPWEEVVLRTRDGVPYLAPEVQLLFKAKGLRPKDEIDARQIVPTLAPDRRARLQAWLDDGHPWQKLLRTDL
ncbi:amino acid transporter [Acidimicrobiia bacterium EGI L10123]|uniref:nucleotidyltransferase domain-containing protein n=1 Tax=Salinilacustrithrix flava TaxID=2957203 RepID=UPI003D7C3502|nr:amino acid transporter [Acidimicrobiia bacterium EGI L10123]